MPAARIAAAAENWKRKLLDLTKRNRALNLKPTKVSTVAVVDEQPAEIFRELYIRERKMRFKAAPEEELLDTASGDPPANGEEEFESVALDFARYDTAALDEKHTDEWLQTAVSPEVLDKSLRRLDE